MQTLAADGRVLVRTLALLSSVLIFVAVWVTPAAASTAPLATTQAATEVAPHKATLHATVNPGGLKTTYQFQYTTAKDFEEHGYAKAISVPSSPKEAGSGTENVEVSESAIGLDPRTRYHYRVVASNAEGTVYGAPVYKSSFGSSGTGNGQFKVLTDVAIDPTDSSIWVTDDENDRVQHFNASGEYLGQFKSCYDPGAIALNSSGSVYVACSSAQIVQKYNAKGESLKKVASYGTGEGQVHFPLDLAFDSSGNLWVADDENDRIDEFSAEDKFVRSTASGVVNRPWGVGAAPNGNIWVAEWSRVSVLDKEGKLLYRIGSVGSGPGQFQRAVDVEVDKDGYAWVTDALSNRVQIFNEAGEYVTQFGSKGTGSGQFNTDWWLRIAVGGNGDVWVTDQGNARVERWLYGAVPTVTTKPASSVSEDEATLKGIVNPEGLKASYQFQYTTAKDFEEHGYAKASSVPASPKDIGAGTKDVEVSQSIESLEAGTTYHFRVVAESVAGISEGKDETFTPPLEGVTASISGQLIEGKTLTATPGVWPDAAGSLVYQWEYCNTSGGECAAAKHGRSRSFYLKHEAAGHTVRVKIAGESEPTLSATSETSGVVLEEEPRGSSTPSIYGEASQGRTLSTIAGEWQPETAVVSRQWRRCDGEGLSCEAIEAATGQDYVVQAADVGSTIRIAETATTTGGSTTHLSEPTEQVPTPALLNSSPPTITESASEHGEVMTAHPGEWAGEGEIFYSYAWRRCNAAGGACADLLGENGPTYSPKGADVGARIRVEVTAANASDVETVSSAPTSVIVASAPVNASVPAITGRALVGEALKGESGKWSGVGPVQREVQWERCNSLGEACEAISGATDSELKLSAEEVGSTIRLQVTATNETGSTGAISAATKAVAAAGPAPELVSAPSISGDTEVGEELVGESGVWSGAVEYEYEWNRCDGSGQACERIVGATEATYLLAEEDIGAMLEFEVRALAEDESAGFASAVTGQSVRVPSGPANVEAPALEGVAKVAETVSVKAGSWTGSEPITFTYSWQVCDAEGCSDIGGATSAGYTLTSNEVLNTVRAVVTAHNSVGDTTATSAATLPVGSVTPFNETAPTIAGGSRVGDTLSAAPGTWDGEATIEYAYQWQRCDSAGAGCKAISGAIGSGYELGSADVGATLRAFVTASNAHGKMEAASAPSAPISDATGPVEVKSPAISGVAESGQTFAADPGSWEEAASYAYQWQRCVAETAGADCANIPAATSNTYTATHEDVGTVLRLAVTATGPGGVAVALSKETESVEPSLLPSEEPGALANTSPPVLEGEAEEMETLTADPGSWQSEMPISFKYRWRRCDADGGQCANIEGSSGSTYVLQSGDIGATIRVVVTAENGLRKRIVVSDPSVVVKKATPRNVVLPSIHAENGEMIAGELLLAEPGTWHGEGLSFGYQWQRCDENGEECTNIGGATEASYLTQPVDTGMRIRVKVTATNELGSTDAISTVTEIIAPPLQPVLRGAPPSIVGQPFDGRQFTAKPGDWAGQAPIEFSYQWQRCDLEGKKCEDIEGATAENYLSTKIDLEHTIRAKVTALNPNGSNAAFSEHSGPIGSATLSNVTVPSISGGNRSGQELKASTGEWAGSGPIEFSYQWRRCNSKGESCENIAGETKASYTAGSADVKHSLRAAVTATGALGSTSTESNALAILPALSVNLSLPTISGTTAVGETLSASSGEWSPAPEKYLYEWLKCGEDFCTGPLSTKSSYTLKASDLGYEILVDVTAFSEGDTGPPSASSELTAPVSEGEEAEESESPWYPVNEGAPEIEGTAKVGETLLAVNGEWGGGPASFDYLWKRCDKNGHRCSLASEPESSTFAYKVGGADAGGTIRLQVTASNKWGSVTAMSKPTAVVPTGPTIANVSPPSINGFEALRYGESYHVGSIGIWTGEPIIKDQWQHCTPPATELACTDISGATDAEDYVPQVGDVGYRLRLKETAIGAKEEVTVYSEPTKEVTASISYEAESFNGLAVVGATITASNTFTSKSGLPVTTEYKFQRLGGAGSPVLLQEGASSKYEIAKEDVGHEIKIEAKAKLWRADKVVAVVTASTSVNTPKVDVQPTNDTLPSFSGDPVAGGLLAAKPGEWHGGGGALGYAYQWKRCDSEGNKCEALTGATAATYTPVGADVGAAIRLAVTASNGPVSGLAVSAAGEPIGSAVAPKNEETPTITGETVTLATVTADPGAWAGTEVLSYSYQWQGCEPKDASACLDIEGATNPTLKLDAIEAGQWLRVLVTATNGGGSATAASELVGPVEEAPAPELIGIPSLSLLGPPAVGSTLMTDGGAWEHVDPTELEYQWQRCDAQGEECKEIGGADTASYQLGEEDIGFRLQVEVSAESSSQRVSAISELSPEIGKSTGSAEGEVVYLKNSAIYLSDLEGESQEEIADCELLVSEECSLYGPRISPNGKLIAVEVRAEKAKVGEGAIFLINFDGTEARLFAEGSQPSWSNDGTQLYFTTVDPEEPKGTRVVAVSADGSDLAEPTTLFAAEAAAESVDISPDEESIAYAAKAEGKSGIYVGQIGSTSAARLDLGAEIEGAFDPRFTPDGRQIVFTAISTHPTIVHYGEEELTFGDLRKLWIVDANGTGLHSLGVSGDTMTYGAPSVNEAEILVGREEEVFVSFGDGGFFTSHTASPLRLSLTGAEPHVFPVDGATEPYSLIALGPRTDTHDCARGKRVCAPWGDQARLAAAAYAEKWSKETTPKFNESYWHVGNNCTNFMSQAWHKAGQVFMDEWTRSEGDFPNRWWADKSRETKEEMNNSNYTWANANGFLGQQVNSGRARDLGRFLAPDFQEADVILLNWRESPHVDEENEVANHAVIVTQANAAGRFVASETAARHHVSWHEYFTKIVPSFFSEDGHIHEKENPYGWTWEVLRPLYKASNLG